MITDSMTIDLIERGIDSHPTCQCGHPTTAVTHGDAMWIECTVLSRPAGTRLRRTLAALTEHLHYRENLGEVRAA